MSRKQKIQQIINSELNPIFLEVENESFKHHVPKDAETHFKLVIVSRQFNELTKIARHRLINHLLAAEFKEGLHALSLHLFTMEEWQAREQKTTTSPACRDGYRHG